MKTKFNKYIKILALSLSIPLVTGISQVNTSIAAEATDTTSFDIHYIKEDLSGWFVDIADENGEIIKSQNFHIMDKNGSGGHAVFEIPGTYKNVKFRIRYYDSKKYGTYSDPDNDGWANLEIIDGKGSIKVQEGGLDNNQSQVRKIVKVHYNKKYTENILHTWTKVMDGNNNIVDPDGNSPVKRPVDGLRRMFNLNDEKGQPYIEFDVDPGINRIYFLVHNKNNGKYYTDLGYDAVRYIDLKADETEVWLNEGDNNVYYGKTTKPEDKNQEANNDQDKNDRVKLKIHYDGDDSKWFLWLFGKGEDGSSYYFNAKDAYGKVADVEVPTKKNEIGFIVRDESWGKDIDGDRFVDLSIGREIWIKSGTKDFYYQNPKPITYNNLKAKINYRRFEMNEGEDWIIKAWTDGQDEGQAQTFKLEKGQSYYQANPGFKKDDIKKIYFRIYKLDKEGEVSKTDGGIKTIDNFDKDGFAETWILQDIDKLYYEEGPVKGNLEISRASIDTFREINIKLTKSINIKELLENGYDFEPKSSNINKGNITFIGEKNNQEFSDEIKVSFNRDLDLGDVYKFKFYFGENKIPLEAKTVVGRAVSDPKFDERFATRPEEELGAIYDAAHTEFKIWAPTAEKVNLVVFNNDGTETTYPMKRQTRINEYSRLEDHRVYTYTLEGDQDKTVYMYDIHLPDGTVNRVVDPYAKSTTINGEKSVVVNTDRSMVERPNKELIKNPVIYELHVRDLSNQVNSGIKNRGKFLGLTEEGTKTKDTGFTTGLDYIANLGVTHIQLLPIYDYSSNSVDENDTVGNKYNWGYDPQNYNTPEGAYSTNPNNPYSRIRELQDAVDAIHKKGMGVIMDVVYNHVFDTKQQSFNQVVPGYYFRQDKNGKFFDGTGCGNESASERKMVQKYIVDSVKYWAKTYKLDGFRFDLMGILDAETMNIIADELYKINPNIIIYGEGWEMGNHPFGVTKANYNNGGLMPNIGFFNDKLRDATKGSTYGGDHKGFVSGGGNEWELFNSIKTYGNLGGRYYNNPRQLIQYTEAHDNHTVYDRLKKFHPYEDEETLLKRQQMATAIPLLAQGIPFIHAGQEFARTKGGNENTYNASPETNEIDWSRAEKYKDKVDYISEIIKIRKAEPLFWNDRFDKVDQIVQAVKAENGLVAYSMRDKGKLIYIGHNREKYNQSFNVENGSYKVMIRNGKASSKSIETIEVTNGLINIEALSTLMIEKTNKLEDKKDEKDWSKEIDNLINKIDDLKISNDEKFNLAKKLNEIKDRKGKRTEADYNEAKGIFDKVAKVGKTETSQKPTLNPINKDSTKISGTGVPGAKIEIYYGSSENDLTLLPISITVGSDGIWSVDKPPYVGLGEAYILSVIQKEEGKKPSIKVEIKKVKAGEKEKPETKPEGKAKEKDSWDWNYYYRLLGESSQMPKQKTSKITQAQYDRLRKAYMENKIMVKSAKFLLENAPNTIKPVKAKLERQVKNAEAIIERTEKILKKLDETGLYTK